MRRWIAISAALLIACAMTVEAGLRLALDFPLFRADREVGYYPRPSQHGRFLFRNDWAFNALGMGVAREFVPSADLDLLLVGDSIVFGGNPVAQADKLGPTLERRTGWHVWPVSAGSWALQNELAYLRRMPQAVQGVDTIVFVLNSQDFGAPSSWFSPYTHPRERPGSYIAYTLGKLFAAPPQQPRSTYLAYAVGKIFAASPDEIAGLTVPQRDVAADWTSFVGRTKVPIVVIGVPNIVQADCSWLPKYLHSAAVVACAKLADADYRDGIHLTAAGRGKLAALIAREIAEGESSSADGGQAD